MHQGHSIKLRSLAKILDTIAPKVSYTEQFKMILNHGEKSKLYMTPFYRILLCWINHDLFVFFCCSFPSM